MGGPDRSHGDSDGFSVLSQLLSHLSQLLWQLSQMLRGTSLLRQLGQPIMELVDRLAVGGQMLP